MLSPNPFLVSTEIACSFDRLHEKHFGVAVVSDTEIEKFVQCVRVGDLRRCYLEMTFVASGGTSRPADFEARSIAPGMDGLRAYTRMPQNKRFVWTKAVLRWKTVSGEVCQSADSISEYGFDRLWALLDWISSSSRVKLERIDTQCDEQGESIGFVKRVHLVKDDLPF